MLPSRICSAYACSEDASQLAAQVVCGLVQHHRTFVWRDGGIYRRIASLHWLNPQLGNAETAAVSTAGAEAGLERLTGSHHSRLCAVAP